MTTLCTSSLLCAKREILSFIVTASKNGTLTSWANRIFFGGY